MFSGRTEKLSATKQKQQRNVNNKAKAQNKWSCCLGLVVSRRCQLQKKWWKVHNKLVLCKWKIEKLEGKKRVQKKMDEKKNSQLLHPLSAQDLVSACNATDELQILWVSMHWATLTFFWAKTVPTCVTWQMLIGNRRRRRRKMHFFWSHLSVHRTGLTTGQLRWAFIVEKRLVVSI